MCKTEKSWASELDDESWNESKTLAAVTDNQALAEVMGRRGHGDAKFLATTDEIFDIITNLFVHKGWGPWSPTADPIPWKQPAWNQEADFLANSAMDHKQDFSFQVPNTFAVKMLMG